MRHRPTLTQKNMSSLNYFCLSGNSYVLLLLFSGPSPEELKHKKQSLASRLSEKFQASLSSVYETDDDFQPERKRIRSVEHKVLDNLILNLLCDVKHTCKTFHTKFKGTANI